MADIVCISPVDGREVARKTTASAADIESAIAAARKAQAAWVRVPVAERAKLCSAAVDAMLAMRAEIAPELSWQMGRPIKYAGGELGGFEERARHMIAIADEALAPLVPAARDGFKRYVRRDPAGIVLTVAPWNYPYLTAVNSVIPALMAGNAVILKAAAQTILVGDRFQSAMDKAGLPKGCSARSRSRTTTPPSDRLRPDRPGLFHWLGRGWPRRGSSGRRHLHRDRARARRQGPGLCARRRRSSHAIENIVDGAYFNSGQCCCGIERIYVHEDDLRHFVEGFRRLTGNTCSAIRSMRRRRSARWRSSASPHSCADISRKQGKGRQGADRSQGLSQATRRLALSRAAGAGRMSTTMKVMMEETFGPCRAS
jgi:acyl-CoA reductase-like NAD-dependent aldehyde dehydrogenase